MGSITLKELINLFNNAKLIKGKKLFIRNCEVLAILKISNNNTISVICSKKGRIELNEIEVVELVNQCNKE